MNRLKRSLVTTVAAGSLLMTGAFATPAFAQDTKQDGLVNVSIGDVTVLQDVNIAAAVDVVAQVCGIDLDVLANVQLLTAAATLVDNRSRNFTVCRTEDGKVQITQN
jgi:hypothetical protein